MDHAIQSHRDELDRFKKEPEPEDLQINCPDCQLKVSSNEQLSEFPPVTSSLYRRDQLLQNL